MRKINWENSPSTNTPLSAENLNLMQNYIEQTIRGTSIYENNAGTTGNLNFSSAIEEGDTVEIYYARKRATDESFIYKTTGQLPFVNNMEVHLDIIYRPTSEQNQMISKAIKITSTGITVLGENQFQSNSGDTISSETINILKVIKRTL